MSMIQWNYPSQLAILIDITQNNFCPVNTGNCLSPQDNA